MKRWIAGIVLTCLMTVTLCGCGLFGETGGGLSGTNTGAKKGKDLTFSQQEKTYALTFSDEDTSPKVTLSADAYASLSKTLSEIENPYLYEQFYGVEEAFERFVPDEPVAHHQCTARDGSGQWTTESLLQTVTANNQARIERESSSFLNFKKELKEDELEAVCQLILDTLTAMQERYPDIDYDRVDCNLGRLVIFYDKSTLDNAYVTKDMEMFLGTNTMNIVDILAGDNGRRDVIIHEIMHVVQYACPCGEKENCSRHLGFCRTWEDLEQNGSDWLVLMEGGAEQSMSLLTGDPLITYVDMVNYLKTLDYVTCLTADAPADGVETLGFYTDPNRLFELFLCENKTDKLEIMKMLRSLDVIQNMPQDFEEAYEAAYNVDLSDDETASALRRSLKPAICVTIAKTFYRSLAKALTENDSITENDVYFLIKMMESVFSYHTLYPKEERADVNRPFLETYPRVREVFMETMKEAGNGVSLDGYLAYTAFSDAEKNAANASFSWLTAEKKALLGDRRELVNVEIDDRVK